MIKTGILIISTEKFLVSKMKQKCQTDIVEGYSELHQQHELEIESLRTVWEHKDLLSKLISKRRSSKKRVLQNRRRA